jgi:predicted Rossmann-fold nucleotide-binding protein
MKVLVCGGKNFNDDDWLFEVLNLINDTYNLHNKITKIIHGGAKGADSLAGLFARANNIPVDVYKADWKTFPINGGIIRNQLMLEDSKPDLVVAFPGGRGTANMVKIAKDAGVKVIEYTNN